MLKVILLAAFLNYGHCSGITGGKFYTVLPGDTLWAIAGREYCRPWMWPAIFEEKFNFGTGDSPDLIYPGHRLWLPLFDFRPERQSE